MYLLYVDESGDPGPQGSPFLVLGAAALFEGKWFDLEADLRKLLDRFFPSGRRPDEFHLSELRTGKKSFRQLTSEQRASLERAFCDLALSFLPTELVMFAVVADKLDWFQKNPGKSGDDLYAALFEDLSSRFDYFLRRRYADGFPSKGIVIADPHKPALSDALKQNQKTFQREGHRWNDRLRNLIETVFFLPSSDSPGLQLADLASYGMWRLVSANDDQIARRIESLFDREPLSSTRNPGKWHGIKFLGQDPLVDRRIRSVWQ